MRCGNAIRGSRGSFQEFFGRGPEEGVPDLGQDEPSVPLLTYSTPEADARKSLIRAVSSDLDRSFCHTRSESGYDEVRERQPPDAMPKTPPRNSHARDLQAVLSSNVNRDEGALVDTPPLPTDKPDSHRNLMRTHP